MSSVQADLRALPWWAVAPLILFAVLVLAVRIAGLAVAFVVDVAERLDMAVATAAGISPLGASTWLLPPDTPIPGWTPRGGTDD